MVRHIATSAGCVLACGIGLLSVTSASQQAPASPPAFRSRTDVVQFDVLVLDKNRQPVRGLTEKDFTVLEDGKAQRIVALANVDARQQKPVSGWMNAVSPDVATNELQPDSRLFVLVMDDALIPQEPWAVRASKDIAKAIIGQLGPQDLTAVVFTGDNRRAQDFTNDKAKLIATLDGFSPGLVGYRFGLETGGTDTDLTFYQATLGTLSGVAAYLESVPQRRKAVFWVSPGVPMDMCGVRPEEPGRPPGPPSACRMPPEEMVDLARRTDEIFRRAQRANVSVYPIDPVGLGGMREYLRQRIGEGPARIKATAQQDFLAATAANTGGRAVMNINQFNKELASLFEENSFYYLVAFESAGEVRSGKLRRIEVRVNRPGLKVQARKGYYTPEPDGASDRRPLMGSQAEEALRNALGGTLPQGGLPLRVAVAPFAVPGQRLTAVSIVLGVRQPIPVAPGKERLSETTELQTRAFTSEGEPRGIQRQIANVVLRGGADGDAAYEVLSRIDLPSGRFQLRLAAHNSMSGKDGSVFIDVEVPDYFNSPFSVSPIVLSAYPGRAHAPRDLLASLLPVVPTAERVFQNSDQVTTFCRIYQGGQKSLQEVRLAFQIRDSQDRTELEVTRLLRVDEFAIDRQRTETAAPSAGSQQAGGGTMQTLGRQAESAIDRVASLSLRTADVAYVLPLSRLSPGRHLLVIEAAVGAEVVRREVVFELK